MCEDDQGGSTIDTIQFSAQRHQSSQENEGQVERRNFGRDQTGKLRNKLICRLVLVE